MCKPNSETPTTPAEAQDSGGSRASSGSDSWEDFYHRMLDEEVLAAQKCHRSGDMHGYNFHLGKKSGFINTDIWMQSRKSPK